MNCIMRFRNRWYCVSNEERDNRTSNIKPALPPPLGEQIIGAPTLTKTLPLPLRRFIGDMSETEKILLGLDLREKGTKPE